MRLALEGWHRSKIVISASSEFEGCEMDVSIVSDIFSFFQGWPGSTFLDAGFIPWDFVALLAAVRPHLFTRH